MLRLPGRAEKSWEKLKRVSFCTTLTCSFRKRPHTKKLAFQCFSHLQVAAFWRRSRTKASFLLVQVAGCLGRNIFLRDSGCAKSYILQDWRWIGKDCCATVSKWYGPDGIGSRSGHDVSQVGRCSLAPCGSVCVCNCLLALRRGVAACCSMFLLHVGSIVFRNMLLASRSLMRQGGFRCMSVRCCFCALHRRNAKSCKELRLRRADKSWDRAEIELRRAERSWEKGWEGEKGDEKRREEMRRKSQQKTKNQRCQGEMSDDGNIKRSWFLQLTQGCLTSRFLAL